MKFKDAKKLHHEDEVLIKKTGEILTVIEVKHEQPKQVNVLLSDGLWYSHKDIK